ncbi:MAG: prolyl oligopeptidase family serine peptidase [Bacteroidales bacterium]
MRHSVSRRRWSVLLVALLLGTASLGAQQKKPAAAQTPAPVQAKKAITHDVYDSWRSIQGTRLSRDGTWVVYALVAQDGDGELVVRNLKTGAEYRQPRGRDAVLTPDAAYVVFSIAPKKADTDKAKKDKKKPEEMPKSALGIMTLADGKVTTVERVKSFKAPEESSRFVAYLMEAPEKKPGAKPEAKPDAAKPEEKTDAPKKKEKKKDAGTELVVRELSTGNETKAAEVIEYAWNKDGSWLAYATASAATSKTPGDGVFARRVADGTVKNLLTGEGHYKGLAFDENGTQLAFLTDRDTYKNDAPAFRLYHWTNTADTAAEIFPATVPAPGMPAGWAVSENGALAFSKDGTKLFFGTAPAPKADPDDAPEPAKVDIWHYKDPELQPMQKVRAEEEKKRNYRAVVSVKDRKFVQLATVDMPDIRLSDDGNTAIGVSDVPYKMLVSWDSSYSDYYAVSLADGSRRKLVEKSRNGAALSPKATYLLTFDAGDYSWYSIRVADGKKTNLTAKLGVHFEDESGDTPEPQRAHGSAGWTEGDKSVLLYDEFDIWEVNPDGTGGRMITRGLGRKTHVVFRHVRLDAAAGPTAAGRRAAGGGADEAISPTKPLLLSAVNDVTKASGFYRLASLSASTDPSKLVMMDKSLGGVLKAKNAEVYVHTEQRFEEFPNLWLSDATFANAKKISDANPQQANYLWGRSELIDFNDTDGQPLRAILTKPENFDPSKTYPMMVYIYEKLTDGVHRYVAPAPGSSSINVARFVSNGYIVLQPDITYRTGYPGQAALRCVIPAVQKVLAMGFVDPKRVGIQGHSWGGYQITYLVTQTNMFRAVEAGASVTDMISAYGGIRWGTGMSRAFQYEHTQSRIGAPPWERPLQFIENSPIFWVEKVQTPYLTMHNDDDDAVPWYQGIEFFSAMRRLGKEAYMFVYNGEKHGLRDRENMKHWTVHMDEYFDYFLLNAPKPDWMEHGVPYLEKGKRDLRGVFGTKTTDR